MKAQELRRQAAEIRHAANHAERREDAAAEFQHAAKLEAEADRLDGAHKAASAMTEETRRAARKHAEQARQQRVARACADIAKKFGRKA